MDQERYEQLRVQLVDRNEANVGNIYLDVLGIPTVGLGVALTARQADRTMALDEDHVDALADVLSLNPRQRQQLTGLLQDQLAVQNQHVDERHNNLRAFLASDFGQDSQRVLGPMVNTRHNSPSGASWSWDVLTSAESPMQVQLTRQQSLDLFDRVAPEYEGRLNNTLRRGNCPSEALSEEQRAAIYSMVYQGASGKARRTADAIGDYWRGEVTEDQLRGRLRTAVNDPAFPDRSRNELEFLENIVQSPVRQAQPAEELQPVNDRARTQNAQNDQPEIAPNGPGNGGARPEVNPQRPDDQGRQRMIEEDRPGARGSREAGDDPRNPEHRDHRLNSNIAKAVALAEVGISKEWGKDSEALAALLYEGAVNKRFGPDDELVVGFNERTATRQSGEIAFLWRKGGGASPDPYENRVQVPTNELRNSNPDEIYQRAATLTAERAAAEVTQHQALAEQQQIVQRVG